MPRRLSLHLSSRPMTILASASSLVLIAAIWTFTLAILNLERNESIDAAIRENQNRAVAFEQYVTRTLEAANLAAQHIGDGLGADLKGEARGRPPRALSGRVASNPLFSAILVTDARGDVRYTNLAGAPALNVSARPTFQALRRDPVQTPIISKPGVAPILGRPLFALTRAITDAEGRFAGTVVIQMPVERLTAFNEGARIRPLDLISVIRRDGVTLARRTGTRITYGEDLRGKLVMEHQNREPNGTYLGPSVLDGKMRYFSHRRLSEFPIFVTVGVGEQDVLAPVRERRRRYFAAATALSAALVALAFMISAGARRRERAARELAEANRRFAEAQRIGRIGDWAYDPETRTLTYSAPLCEMYGRSPADDRLTLEEALAPYDAASRERLSRAIDAALATGEPQQCECVAEIRPGQQSIRRLVFSPVVSEKGEVRVLTGTDQDVSREKLHERLRDEVAHLGRVESMNIMAVTIAHEFAQPLTATSNYLMVARAYAGDGRPDGDDRVRGALEKVDQQVSLMREIMHRTREMLSNRTSEDDIAPVRAVVDDAISLVRVANRFSAIEIHVVDFDETLVFAANKVQVQQVLMNLLRNASEAVKDVPGPRITVSAKCEPDGFVTLCVEDNGPGIPAGLDDGFSGFAKTGSAGMGLGLSISRAIVESYGGSIWLDRERTLGSGVCFRLPGGAHRRHHANARA
jgi:signal transduction histidine kinase